MEHLLKFYRSWDEIAFDEKSLNLPEKLKPQTLLNNEWKFADQDEKRKTLENNNELSFKLKVSSLSSCEAKFFQVHRKNFIM